MNNPTDPWPLLGDGEVHVCHVNLEDAADAAKLESLLSPDEIQRANRFRFPDHRRRFVIARGCLRRLLAQYLGISAGDIAFHYLEAGKPELAAEHGSDLCFNVSHSGDLAVFAFTRARRIGVDVEMIRHDIDVDEIPKRFFSILEQETISKLAGSLKYSGFFNCWTRKEAYVKAVGSGLSLPLRDFDVSLAPGDPAMLLATRPDPAVSARWSVTALDFGETFAAAVIVEGVINNLRVWQFSPRS